jgi:ABC-type Fe3+/spermidine/putrescine transport system ATPase subunit
MLEIINLSKNFNNQTQALEGVSLNIKKGEFVSILGPSGSGKTTLLRSLNGLESIDSGEVIFDNKKITNET